MNRAKTSRSGAGRARIETEIDHILAGEEELMPSSGFVASVMEQVRQEAAMPEPIPFPWKMAIPLLLLVCGGVGWSTVELVRIGMRGRSLTALGLTELSQLGQSWWTFTLPPLSTEQVRSLEQAGWVALALGISLLSWLLSRRLAGRGGLL
ncbi:MAG: hypothetical protein ACLPXT_06990 [Terracidiphilus sp.]